MILKMKQKLVPGKKNETYLKTPLENNGVFFLASRIVKEINLINIVFVY